MRVVFDTNIFVSAFAIPGGQSERAIMRIVDGTDRLIISKPIIHELLGILSTKFSHDTEQLSHVAVYLVELGEMVSPRRKLKVLNDEADNRILECAMTGKTDIIVTGDKAMLKHREYKGIRIISLREYLENA